jgi:hypothetical protein
MTSNDDAEFLVLLKACHDLAEDYPDAVFIGGIAVYLHAMHGPDAQDAGLAETTHDADLYMSIVDTSSLRENEEVVTNRRLGKSEFKRKGFSFDLYTERHANLRLPFDEIQAHSVQQGSVRVACLEHLLILKLEAFKDRRGSAKGQKDARDLVRIIVLAQHGPHQGFRPSLLGAQWTDDDTAMIAALAKGSAAMELARHNPHNAKTYRAAIESAVRTLEAMSRPATPGKSRRP